MQIEAKMVAYSFSLYFFYRVYTLVLTKTIEWGRTINIQNIQKYNLFQSDNLV